MNPPLPFSPKKPLLPPADMSMVTFRKCAAWDCAQCRPVAFGLPAPFTMAR